MTSVWRALRRRVLTPNQSETTLVKRGFHVNDGATRALLETIGQSFLTGYGYAAEARTPAAAEERLETVERDFRGFAYEGAAMGFAIMDALGLGGGPCVQRFLDGRAGRHVYMVHVGLGWALARLPRWLWRRVLPTDPLLGWLALDGYGFHQAYFDTDRYVRDQFRDPDFAWPANCPRGYPVRVVDQGIGRALWFVEGADVDRVATAIDRFAPDRRTDLFSGAGLAATYAGGAHRAALESFWRAAGAHRPAVAQGCAFAAQARVRAGLVNPHTHTAVAVFCSRSVEQAAAMTDDALLDLPDDGPLPRYQVWRQRVASEFATLGRW
jgi:hypothetical protein